MTRAPLSRVDWSKTHRLINSAYPPIDLFEDIALPEDWDLLAKAEMKTNPRLAESIGNLDLVPKERRVGGPGASVVMAPFTHASPDKPGRFHDGLFGAYYAADNFDTALFETVHHQARFCAATREEPGWIADMRELVGSIDAELVDIRGGGFAELLNKDDYTLSQRFAREAKSEGANGIVFPSVRDEGGECFAAFYPDVVGIPKQGEHLSYHWDGGQIDQIRFLTGERIGIYLIVP